MKIIIENNYEKLSETTAQILLGCMYQDKRVNVAITSGDSPKGAYSIVTPVLKEHKERFSNVHYYNFDNVEMKGFKDGMTLGHLQEQFFGPGDVALENIHGLKTENYAGFDERIMNAGGLDLMLIGMGSDGHFCGNLPYSTQFDRMTYSQKIDPQYPWYEWITAGFVDQEIPDDMVTMGAAALMKVKRVVMIVNGERKAAAVKQFMEAPMDNKFPSTILRLHPNFTIIMDKEAAAQI